MQDEILDAPLFESDGQGIEPVGKGKRFANYIIDIICFYVFIIGLAVVLEIMGSTFFYTLAEQPIIDRIVSILMYGVFMCIQEVSFGGRSIGKFITGTKVVNEDGYKPDAGTLLQRNMFRCVPFDQLSFLGDGSGWHDRWSDTYVVSAR